MKITWREFLNRQWCWQQVCPETLMVIFLRVLQFFDLTEMHLSFSIVKFKASLQSLEYDTSTCIRILHLGLFSISIQLLLIWRGDFTKQRSKWFLTMTWVGQGQEAGMTKSFEQTHTFWCSVFYTSERQVDKKQISADPSNGSKCMCFCPIKFFFRRVFSVLQLKCNVLRNVIISIYLTKPLI